MPHHHIAPIDKIDLMQFDLTQAIQILDRTPSSFYALLNNLDDEWTSATEGEGSWSAKDVVAHLVYLDKANWLHRARLLLTSGQMVRFDPLNRNGGKTLVENMSVAELLTAFRQTRNEVLHEIKELRICETHYGLTAIHPDFGEVKLSQLLSAWVVHDLSHLSQVCRILSKQYREEVGPWISFLRILN